MSKKSEIFALFAGVSVLSIFLGYTILAWTEPGGTPPDNNVAAPVNIGSGTQTKSGSLNIAGNVGVGTTSPTKKLEVAGGVKGTELCIGNSCCSDWATCVALGGGCKAVSQACTANSECCSNSCVSSACASGGGSSCKTTDQPCATNTDCCSSSCVSGACQPDPLIVNCNSGNLGAGIKRIFVTGPYIATDLKNDSVANAHCTSVAGSGSYKALVYLGGELPSAKLPSNNEFWNCQQVTTGSTKCVCNRVARHKLDLFTKKTDGSYLLSPIIGTESGTKMAGVRVWTNFRPDGTGGTTQLNSSTFGSTGSCYPDGYQPCSFDGYSSTSCYGYWCQGCNSSGGCSMRCRSGQSWYGLTSSTDLQWAYVADPTNMSNNTSCWGYSRAIYCVEQ